jgi:hypothetical protein
VLSGGKDGISASGSGAAYCLGHGKSECPTGATARHFAAAWSERPTAQAAAHSGTKNAVVGSEEVAQPALIIGA